MFTKKYVVVAVLSLLSLAAHALPSPSQIYTAEANAPGGIVTANVLAARAAFLGTLDNTAQSFGFELLSLVEGSPPPTNIVFTGSAGSITATVAVTGSPQVATQSVAGRFNTTEPGSKYLRVNSASGAGNFSLTFDRDISAFGFYGTDIGDFGGMLSLVLTPSGGGPTETLDVRALSTTPAASGSLLFYGFSDRNSSYRSISFVSTGTNAVEDFFGFDDFVVADRGQIRAIEPPSRVPEPGSLALAGLALLAAGVARNTRRAA